MRGNEQDYGMRIYDPRLGKFLSVDPLSADYPFYSPYQFAGNNPIGSVDIDGLEPDVTWNVNEQKTIADNNNISSKLKSTICQEEQCTDLKNKFFSIGQG